MCVCVCVAGDGGRGRVDAGDFHNSSLPALSVKFPFLGGLFLAETATTSNFQPWISTCENPLMQKAHRFHFQPFCEPAFLA